MEDYFIVYGWYQQDNGQIDPIPWCVTKDEGKAINYHHRNTDESLSLVVVKTKLNPLLMDLNEVTEALFNYVNDWTGDNKKCWSSEEWDKYSGGMVCDDDIDIFTLPYDEVKNKYY